MAAEAKNVELTEAFIGAFSDAPSQIFEWVLNTPLSFENTGN